MVWKKKRLAQSADPLAFILHIIAFWFKVLYIRNRYFLSPLWIKSKTADLKKRPGTAICSLMKVQGSCSSQERQHFVYIYIYICIKIYHYIAYPEWKSPSFPHLVFDPPLPLLPSFYLSLHSKHITTVYAPPLSTECVNGMLVVSIAPSSVQLFLLS